MKQLTIGDVTITSIIERDGPWRRPEEMFPAYDPAIGKRHLAELDPEVFDPVSGKMVITYQTYVVRTPKHTILIDTCTGEDKGYPPPMDFPKQPWLDGLAAAGLRFGDIDYVFCTHLYIDLSLLKTVNYQESLGIFLCDRRTVGRHDHYSICSRVRALVPVSQPSVAGTRACRAATSADHLAAATPSPPSGFIPPIGSCGCAFTEYGRGSLAPWYSSNPRRWSNGIAKAFGSTGGGDHAVPDAPRRAPKSGP